MKVLASVENSFAEPTSSMHQTGYNHVHVGMDRAAHVNCVSFNSAPVYNTAAILQSNLRYGATLQGKLDGEKLLQGE